MVQNFLLWLQEPWWSVKVGRSKRVDSKAVLQAIEASHSPVWFPTFTILAKSSEVAKLCFMLPKYCKTFDLMKIIILKE